MTIYFFEFFKVNKISTNILDLFKVSKTTISFLGSSKSVIKQKQTSKKQPSEKKIATVQNQILLLTLTPI